MVKSRQYICKVLRIEYVEGKTNVHCIYVLLEPQEKRFLYMNRHCNGTWRNKRLLCWVIEKGHFLLLLTFFIVAPQLFFATNKNISFLIFTKWASRGEQPPRGELVSEDLRWWVPSCLMLHDLGSVTWSLEF